MRTVTVEIEGLTPYSQSKPLRSVKKEKETHDQFDQRIWDEHVHYNDDGDVVIPTQSFLGSLVDAAKLLSKNGQLKKKGNSTWSENFVGGISMRTPPILIADDPKPERFFCHADGKRSCGTRVWRTFPMWYKWKAVVEFIVFDNTITEDVFQQCIEASGLLKGIGRYRPANQGQNGRFVAKTIEWSDNV